MIQVKEPFSQLKSQKPCRAEAGQSSCKVLEEETNKLENLMQTKGSFTLEELWELRRVVEEQQQIQMTLKNTVPCKVHIQCKHFKSKKCCFQITFKAVPIRDVSTPASPTSSFLEHPQSKQLLHAPLSFLSAPASSLIQGYRPQPDKGAALHRPNDVDIKQPFFEESVPSPSARSLGEVEAIISQQQGSSCASASLAAKSNLAGINLSSSQILLHANGTRKKEEGNEARLISQNTRQSQQQTQSKASTSEPLQDQKQQSQTFEMFKEVLSYQGEDKQDIVPKLSLENSNHDLDVNCHVMLPETDASSSILLSNTSPHVHTGETSTQQMSENPTATSFKTDNNGQILFKLSNFRLQHRNHPVMSDEEYSVHLAKRWLEGHTEKIERIYSRLRTQKGSSFKITPKIIKKVLQDEFDIDIYARCTEKVHRKLLKKKLDNLIKGIRLHERQSDDKPVTIAAKKTTTKRNPALSKKTKQVLTQSLVNNSKLNNTDLEEEEQIEDKQDTEEQLLSQSQLSSSEIPTAHSAISLDHAEEIEVEHNFDRIKMYENMNNEEDDSSSFRPFKLISDSSEENQQALLLTPEPPQQKVFKEEWESFLALDPPYRIQHAH